VSKNSSPNAASTLATSQTTDRFNASHRGSSTRRAHTGTALGDRLFVEATYVKVAGLDHVLPHSKGGENIAENLVTACWPCQLGRGNDSIERIGLFHPAEHQLQRALPGWDGCDWFG
jgi:hypothetical protein